jgi:hypothetical protein
MQAIFCPHVVADGLSCEPSNAGRFACMVDHMIHTSKPPRRGETSPSLERGRQGTDRCGILFAGRGRVRHGTPALPLAAASVGMARGSLLRLPAEAAPAVTEQCRRCTTPAAAKDSRSITIRRACSCSGRQATKQSTAPAHGMNSSRRESSAG